jgi:hypothetical protein
MSRKRGVQALFLNGRFGKGASSVGPDILANILSKFWLIDMFLQYCHCILYAKLFCHLIVVSFPNPFLSLA